MPCSSYAAIDSHQSLPCCLAAAQADMVVSHVNACLTADSVCQTASLDTCRLPGLWQAVFVPAISHEHKGACMSWNCHHKVGLGKEGFFVLLLGPANTRVSQACPALKWIPELSTSTSLCAMCCGQKSCRKLSCSILCLPDV